LIKNVSHTAAHAGRKVLSGLTNNQNFSTCHIFTAMVAHALHNGSRAGVTNAETLARHTVDVGFTAGRSVQSHISYDNIFIRLKPDALRRVNDQLAAGQSLSEIVIAVADQFQ